MQNKRIKNIKRICVNDYWYEFKNAGSDIYDMVEGMLAKSHLIFEQEYYDLHGAVLYMMSYMNTYTKIFMRHLINCGRLFESLLHMK